MAHVLWPVWILWLMFYAESESYGACSMLSLNLMAHVLCSVWILWRMFMASLNIMAHVLCSVWILWRMFYGQSEYHGACFMVEEEDGGGIGSRTTKLGLWGGGYNAKDRGWGLNRKKPVGGKNWIMIFPLYLPECTEHWSWHLIVCSLWILTYIMAFILLLPWTLRLLLFCYPEHYGACSMASLNIIALVLCSVWILWRMFYGQSEYHGACFMVEEEDGGGIGSRTTKLGLWCGGYNAKDRGWGLNGKNRWGERTESWFFHYIFQNAQNTGHDIL